MTDDAERRRLAEIRKELVATQYADIHAREAAWGDIEWLLRLLDSRDTADISGRQQPSPETTRAPDGHGEPCWYCKIECSSYAGNPGLWPLLLPLDESRPGVCVAVHTGCILDRLASPAAITPRQDTVDVTDEPKQHNSVRADETDGIRIPELTDEQKEYFRDLKARHVDYDPKMVIGGTAVETKSPDYLKGERAGLELAAQWLWRRDHVLGHDMRAARLPPATPEEK